MLVANTYPLLQLRLASTDSVVDIRYRLNSVTVKESPHCSPPILNDIGIDTSVSTRYNAAELIRMLLCTPSVINPMIILKRLLLKGFLLSFYLSFFG